MMTNYDRERIERICRVLRKWISGDIPKKFKDKYSASTRAADLKRLLEYEAQLKTNEHNVNRSGEDNGTGGVFDTTDQSSRLYAA